MRRAFILASLAASLAACVSTHPSDTAPKLSTSEPVIQVMVLGTYHFDNPGLDIVNLKADDVLSAERQAELEALTASLAAFEPTAIAVEVTRPETGLLDPGYTKFKIEDLESRRNEIVQIGYRLANEVHTDRVYAIDENEGELDFFPFDRVQAFAERTGQTQIIDDMISGIQEMAAKQEEAQKTETISGLLADHNNPDLIHKEQGDVYYRLLELSDAEDRAGAVLNYGWYARNALIFANLTEAAEPGDRIIVVYGAGHAYWLRHFIEETPGYELVEALPYLTD